MQGKKIYILLPDGVGVRNFLYTDFIPKLADSGNEVTLWANDDLLSIAEFSGLEKIELPKSKVTTYRTEIYKKAWQIALLKYQAKKNNDEVYLSYIFR